MSFSEVLSSVCMGNAKRWKLFSEDVTTASKNPCMNRLHQWWLACSAYMFCRSQTCVAPLQRSRRASQLQCRRYQTAGSSELCWRCCLIPAPGKKCNKAYIRLCSGLVVIIKEGTLCSNAIFQPFSNIPSLPLLQLLGHRRSCTDAHCPQQAPTGHSGCW